MVRMNNKTTLISNLQPDLRKLILCAFSLMLMGYGVTSNAEYNIGPNDLLGISVFGYEDLKSETRVSVDGHISFPLIGKLYVEDQSTFKVEKLIADKLTKGRFVQGAQVSVTVLENNSQRVSVLGHVNNPGRYSLDSATTLIDVIAMAGGIKETGNETVILTRYKDGKTEKHVVNLYNMLDSSEKTNLITLKPKDKIYVPKAAMFYIYGEVQKPGGYRIVRDMSVVKALSIGGGLTLRGTQNGITIKRKNDIGELGELDVELTDTVVKDDVVYVKERLF